MQLLCARKAFMIKWLALSLFINFLSDQFRLIGPLIIVFYLTLGPHFLEGMDTLLRLFSY